MEALRNKRIDDLSDTLANHRFDRNVCIAVDSDALGSTNITILRYACPLDVSLETRLISCFRVPSDVNAAPAQRKI